MNEFSDDRVSMVLSKDWVVDSSPAGDNTIFQGKNGNKYIILSSYTPDMSVFADMKEAMSELNKKYMEAAQDTMEGKATINDFGYVEEKDYSYSGHMGLIPSRGLVFFRRLIANDQYIANFYIEFGGFHQMPDLKQLGSEFIELSHQISIRK